MKKLKEKLKEKMFPTTLPQGDGLISLDDSKGCFPNLNDQAKLTAFILTSFIGFLVQMLSFDTKDNFFLLYLFAILLQIAGISFYVKPNFAIK